MLSLPSQHSRNGNLSLHAELTLYAAFTLFYFHMFHWQYKTLPTFHLDYLRFHIIPDVTSKYFILYYISTCLLSY